MGRTATDGAQTSEADRARADRAAAARDRDAAAVLLYEAEVARQAAAGDRDCAALSLHQASLERAANQTHWLTGALCRGPGLVALQHEIDRARRVGAELAIGFIDVDGLKHVNDTRGHAAGDRLLRAVVVGLKASVRSYDVIARYGGDEFVYSLAGADDDAAAERFEKRRSFVHVNGDSVSAGFAALRDGDTLDTLVAPAEPGRIPEPGPGPRALGRIPGHSRCDAPVMHAFGAIRARSRATDVRQGTAIVSSRRPLASSHLGLTAVATAGPAAGGGP